MKCKRLLVVLIALTLIFTIISGSALAANKTAEKAAKTKPTLKLAMENNEVESGGYWEVNITASVPGFITLTLADTAGNTLFTLVEDGEIHSKVNDYGLYAKDNSGNPLPAGSYSLVAVMKSQYGTLSDSASKSVTIVPATVIEYDEPEVVNTTETAPAVVETVADPYIPTETATYDPYTETTTETAPLIVPDPVVEPEPTAAPVVEAAPAPTAAPVVEAAPAPTAAPVVEAAPAPAQAPAAPAAVADTNTVSYRASSGGISVGEEGYQIGVGVTDVFPQSETTFWNLPANPSDADIWAAIIHPITCVNVGEQESSAIYDAVGAGKAKLGTVSGVSQGVNVLVTRNDGWSLVEAFRNEDGAFIRGYIKTAKLKLSDVNPTYGIVVDKKTQTLTVYMNGQRIGSCLVCTGLPTPENLQRETPAGEFKVAIRRGTTDFQAKQKGSSRYTIRINNNVYLQEIPTTKRNGSDYSILESYLGTKQTRGTICVQARASQDGGINAEWIWQVTDTNKKIKVLILDDKTRDLIPIGTK